VFCARASVENNTFNFGQEVHFLFRPVLLDVNEAEASAGTMQGQNILTTDGPSAAQPQPKQATTDFTDFTDEGADEQEDVERMD
jgi:hypothetical protein